MAFPYGVGVKYQLLITKDSQNMPTTKTQATIHPTDDKRFRMLTATMKRYQYSADALIEVLHQAQELFGYLEAVRRSGE